MTVEEKVIASVRKILINDSAVNAVVGNNVYASHISSITKPTYPAMSLFLLSSTGAAFDARGYVSVNLQIDVWFPTQQYDTTAVLNMQERLRALLDRQSINDSTIPVSGSGWENRIGPMMVEEDVELMHLPVIYTFMAF